MFEINVTISLKGFKVNNKGFMQCEDAALSINTKADEHYTDNALKAIQAIVPMTENLVQGLREEQSARRRVWRTCPMCGGMERPNDPCGVCGGTGKIDE